MFQVIQINLFLN